MNIYSDTLTKLSKRFLKLVSLLAIIIFMISNDTLSQTYANPAPVPLLSERIWRHRDSYWNNKCDRSSIWNELGRGG